MSKKNKTKSLPELSEARCKLWEAREKAFASKENKNKLVSSILTDLAKVLADQDHDMAAAYSLKEAVLFDSKNAKAFWKLGELLANEGEYEESHSSFERAAKLNRTGCPVGLGHWGRALFRQSEDEKDEKKKAALLDEALKKCMQAHALDERNTTALHFWGEVLKAQRHFKQAIEKFEKANQAEKEEGEEEDHWTICQWALCLSELKKYPEAIKKLEDLLRQQYSWLDEENPDEEVSMEHKADILKTLATILNKQNKKDLAGEKFKEAAALYKWAGKAEDAKECADLAGSSASPSDCGSPAGKSAAKKALHYEKSFSRYGLCRRMWDAFKLFPQPLEKKSLEELYRMAMENNGRLDPTEGRVFEYILSPKTPTQVTPEAKDFLETMLSQKSRGRGSKRDRSRSRSRRGRRRA